MKKTTKTILQPESIDDLPDDADLLKSMLWEVLQSNEDLSNQLIWLKRTLWGKKSEKLVSKDQLALFEEAKRLLNITEPVPSSSSTESDEVQRMPKSTPKTRRGGKRNTSRGKLIGGTVPADTPVKTTFIGLNGATCPECDDPLKVLGSSVRRRVNFEPGHFYIEETVIETGMCPSHPKESIHTPNGPDYIVPGGVLGNELLNDIIIDKFADGLPLNRQSKRFKRQGVHIGTSTLSRNVIAYAALADHIIKAMKAELLESPWLQGDATGLPILIGNLGKTHQGQLWVYSNGETAVFEASLTKHGAIPEAFLEGYSGVWLCDGAPNYNGVARFADVERAGCLAHGRRYIFEARKDHINAYTGLQLIRDLFMLERKILLWGLPERLEHRQTYSKPIVKRLRDWLDVQLELDYVKKRSNSRFAKSVKYLKNQWKTLVLFLEHPEIPIHTNRSELLLRTPVMGRKAWLFAGSTTGADANATLFSLTASCMLQGISPKEYLDDVMPSLGEKTPSEIAELTPSKWAKRKFSKPAEEV